METGERILKAARALFDRGGIEKVSVRAIARKIGVTPMAIYRHFPDKAAIVDALVADGFEAWEARVAAIPEADALKWFEAFAAAFLDFALEEPRRFEAAFLLPAKNARKYPDDFAAGRSPAFRAAAERLAKMRKIARGGATSEEVSMTLWALVQGLVSLYRADRFANENAFRAFYRTAVKRLLAAFEHEEKMGRVA